MAFPNQCTHVTKKGIRCPRGCHVELCTQHQLNAKMDQVKCLTCDRMTRSPTGFCYHHSAKARYHAAKA